MRLIDADALKSDIAKLKESPWFNTKAGYAYRKEAIITVEILCVDRAPTVDPVRHGRWEIYDTYKQTIDGRTFDGWCECSECRTMHPWDFSAYNYCPHCGAKMDGGGEKDGEIH